MSVARITDEANDWEINMRSHELKSNEVWKISCKCELSFIVA